MNKNETDEAKIQNVFFDFLLYLLFLIGLKFNFESFLT